MAALWSETVARGAHRRAFEYALLASLALHVAFFTAFPTLRFAAPAALSTPAPLVAHLQPLPSPPELAPPPPEPMPVAPPKPHPASKPEPMPVAKPEPEPKPRPKSVVRRYHSPMPRPTPRPESRPQSNPVAKPPPAPSPPANASAPPAVSAPAAPPPPLASVAPERVAREATADRGRDALLAQYRLALIEAARRYKRYPRVALDNNWEGKADVRMAIGADGMIASMSIERSSGYEILDHRALDMIRQAKPLAPIPASLRGRPFSVDIPVVFSLEAPES